MPDRFDHSYWEKLYWQQLGVDVTDPQGGRIGPHSAGRYEPVDGRKHVLVGEFDHYGFYNPIFGAEADFNIHIRPSKQFRFLLDQVADAPGFDKSVLQRAQRAHGYCVECEVTPSGGFFGNEYFPTREPHVSPLVGNRIGAYGPWVHDNGHGGRPEIHPCEFLWWQQRDEYPGGTFGYSTRFLLVQDFSHRFSERNDYDGNVARPWTASPLRIDATVALRPPAGESTSYGLQFLSAREVVDVDDADAGGRLIRANLAGQPQDTVLVAKTMELSEMKVSLGHRLAGMQGAHHQLVLDPLDNRFLRCFLKISVIVGIYDVEGGGYALFMLISDTPP